MKKVSELTIDFIPTSKKSIKFLNNISDATEKPKFLHVANSRSGHNFIKDNVLSYLNIEFDNIEYRNLENYKLDRFKDDIKKLSLDSYDKSIKILTLRDILNWYTSYYYLFKSMIPPNKFILNDESLLSTRIINPLNDNYRLMHFGNEKIKKWYLQRHTPKPEKLKTQMKVGLDSWLQNAKEFKGKTSILSGFTHIYYNDFFSDETYRRNICQQLGGTYNEEKLEKVTPQGGFSTFDKDEYQNNAQDMQEVLNRYNKWDESDKEYLDMLFKHDAFKFFLDNFEINNDKSDFIIKNINTNYVKTSI